MIKAHFYNIKEVIIAALQSAKVEIRIAVAWINNNDILRVLDQKRATVKITVITHNDELQNSEALENLNSESCKVYRFKKESGIMHHKFCVVDNHTLLTGSYNWTWGADLHNLENILQITEESELIKQYIEEFDKIVPQYFAYVEETKALINKMIEKLIGLRDRIEKTNDVPTEIRYLLMPYFETKLSEGNAIDVALKLKVENENDILLSERKNETDLIFWWNKLLSQDLKIHFNKNYFKDRKDLTAPKDLKALNDLINLKDLSINHFKPQSEPERALYLGGIEYMEYLENINLSNNKLNGIEKIKKLEYVKSLNVANNELTSLSDIKNFKHLEYLDCTNNQLTHIEEIGLMTALESLKLGFNPIKSFNGLEGLYKLRTLDLNRIDHFVDLKSYKNLISLEKLRIHNVDIDDTIFLENLKFLEIAGVLRFRDNNIPVDFNLNKLECLNMNILDQRYTEIIRIFALLPNMKAIRILNYQKHYPELTEFMELNGYVTKYTSFRIGGNNYKHPEIFIKSNIFENNELPSGYTWF